MPWFIDFSVESIIRIVINAMLLRVLILLPQFYLLNLHTAGLLGFYIIFVQYSLIPTKLASNSSNHVSYCLTSVGVFFFSFFCYNQLLGNSICNSIFFLKQSRLKFIFSNWSIQNSWVVAFSLTFLSVSREFIESGPKSNYGV